MTDTSSEIPSTESAEESHGESHASMSDRKSRRKSRVDTTAAFPQVTKSRDAGEKVTPPLPRKVTFSALSLGRAERDSERGEINNNPTRDPADDDLAARRRAALGRLVRAHHTGPLTKEQKP
ncbi:hypothetical protein ACFUYE_00510 [Micromonospora humida]|uniref:hypothetical protein n=1 Tax=Micromonospora humida TaxID=2809018 RepID=UPI003672D587